MLSRKKPLKPKKALTQKKPLAKRSKKMEAKYEHRRELVSKVLKERPMCQACKVFAAYDGKVTFNQHRSRDVHEIVRRSQGGSILDESNVLAVCRPCHVRIGNFPELAFQLGLAKHGWEK